MSDPFDGHPPQPVVYECRTQDCTLNHHTHADTWQSVEDTIAYYKEQGHTAHARFPDAGDATWPPEET